MKNLIFFVIIVFFICCNTMKIDEIKEILNTLRLFFSIMVGLIALLTSALIHKQQMLDLDIYFWLGVLLDLSLIVGLLFILRSIKNNIKIIRSLK
ncbi:MAG: hypothetical protein DRQ51_08755 [Gammaproteobacteria bacterium]|nr:MAG: hypothetical protein DRQ51_08755 [Gammaproteobacteria bacterium]